MAAVLNSFTWGMDKCNDGEANFGPLIDLYTEEMRPTARDTAIAKSPEPVATSTPQNAGHKAVKQPMKFYKQLRHLVMILTRKAMLWKISLALWVNASML